MRYIILVHNSSDILECDECGLKITSKNSEYSWLEEDDNQILNIYCDSCYKEKKDEEK